MKNETERTLLLLHSGKNPLAKKYAGKHVMVIRNKVIILKEGEQAVRDFKKLKEKYGKLPIITFIPRQDTSYILNYTTTFEKT